MTSWQQALGSSFWSAPDSLPTTFCRDLKAANLLMDDSGIVKIADFGVARVMDTLGVMTAETGTYRWVLVLATCLGPGSGFALLGGCMCSRSCCRGDGLQSCSGAAGRVWADSGFISVSSAASSRSAWTLCPFKFAALKTAMSTSTC